MAHENKETVTVVVAGYAVEVPGNENANLHSLIEKALKLSNNTGQPPGNWEFKDGAGNLLDLNTKLKDLHLGADGKLYLNVKAGIGG